MVCYDAFGWYWRAVYMKNTAISLLCLLFYWRDFPENPHLAVGDKGVGRLYVWSWLVCNEGHFSWKKHNTFSSLNLVFHLRYFPENSCPAPRGNGLQTYICRDLSDMKGSVQKEHRTLFALSCSLFKGLSRKSISGTRWHWPTKVLCLVTIGL